MITIIICGVSIGTNIMLGWFLFKFYKEQSFIDDLQNKILKDLVKANEIRLTNDKLLIETDKFLIARNETLIQQVDALQGYVLYLNGVMNTKTVNPEADLNN